MPPSARDSVARFSDRAEDYAKYRPHYAPDVAHALQQACGLRAEHLIADVGCGPGMLAEIFLQNGNRVIGVEPNREMRVAGEKYLRSLPQFQHGRWQRRVHNSARRERRFRRRQARRFTGFGPPKARAEFARILKPGGWAVLVWHDRDVVSTPFLRDYEDVRPAIRHRLRAGFAQVCRHYDALQHFFAPNEMTLIKQHNQQSARL